jgi:alpha-tubulin suppressor-like RCC1 family protein
MLNTLTRNTRNAQRLIAVIALIAAILTGAPGPRAQADQNEQPGSVNQASISAGDNHTCAIIGGGTVRCWGDNTYGQLGIGNTNNIGDNEAPTQNVNLGGATATAVSAGDKFTCVLLTGGNVRCWGRNNLGQLGIGTPGNIGDDEAPTQNVNLGGATATAISAGGAHVCALLTGGSVRCWGLNNFGQLGIATTDTIGDNETPTQNVDLGGATVRALSVGNAHSCVLFAEIQGNVRCWGNNTFGQLGINNTNIIGDNENPTTNVNLGGRIVTAVTAGGNHTCVLTLSIGPFGGSNVACWGLNNSGQIGIGNTNNIGDDENPTQNVSIGGFALSAGGAHSCAINGASPFNPTQILCWGWNSSGQLGIANTNNRGDDELGFPFVDLGGITPIAVTTGTQHTCAVLTGGSVRCWGLNLSGELGIGSTNTIGDNESPTTNVPNLVIGPDTASPTITITTPTPNQAMAARPVTVAGNATDNVAIVAVQVVVYRPLPNAGQFWNGTGWQATYASVPATLNAPGAASTGWTYSFSPPQTGGIYYVGALALDQTYNYTFTPFTSFSLPDTVVPNATLTPAHNSTTTGPVTISGTATDNSGLYATYVAIYRVSDATYWNGTTWQATFATVLTTLTTPGAATSTYAYGFTPPASGYYLFAALPIDTNYNYNFVAWNTIYTN